MSTISSVTTPAVTTPTAPAEAAKPAETTKPAETATATATANAADSFQKAADKAPVTLNTPVAAEDDWAECEFDNTKSGGGGISAVDPTDARVIRG